MHPRQILAQHDIHPKKSLGQNFLFDDNILRKIAGYALSDAGEEKFEIMEIGSGLGSLTHQLAKSGRRVVALELDNRFIPLLRHDFNSTPNVEIIHGDILEQDAAALFAPSPFRVAANVPYYITGAILRHLLSAEHKPQRIVMTVQQEVAKRLSAPVGKLSLLAVSVRFYGEVATVGKIPAGAFWPRPKVDSAVIRINLHTEPPQVDEKAFFRVAKAGFSQKRKQIKNNLRGLGGVSAETVTQALQAAAIDPRRRAETLTIPEWVALTQHLTTTKE